MFQKISRGVCALLPGNSGSNCFLLQGSKQTTLIDSSSPDNAQLLLDSLKELNLHPEKIGLILHTHCHADHTGGTHLFPNARIAMHEIDAKPVNEKDSNVTRTCHFGSTQSPKVTEFLFDSQLVDLGGIALKVIETPGHTAGSVCFLEEKQRLLFSGDTLFSGSFGRTDLPSGSREQLLESMQKLQKTPFSVLLPGHGPILSGKEQNGQNIQSALRALGKNAFL